LVVRVAITRNPNFDATLGAVRKSAFNSLSQLAPSYDQAISHRYLEVNKINLKADSRVWKPEVRFVPQTGPSPARTPRRLPDGTLGCE